MKKTIFFLSLFCNATILFAQDITGQWNGLLKIQEMPLHIVFHINKNGNNYTGTMDSPDQGAKGIPVSSVSYEQNHLKITAEPLKMEYRGNYLEGKIIGEFTQGSKTLHLELTRDDIKTESSKKSQEPIPPYPYATEDVVFKNRTDGTMLSGTLSRPSQDGKYPAVILITGSGPQNRDEEIMGHKPFLVIADYLTQNGFAVLRYDDRGTAKSNGNFKSATSVNFEEDVEAAIAFLKTRKDINLNKIGLIGHSEGGYIAPMVAGKSKDVAFIVLLAGPGMPCSDLVLLQNALIAKSSGTKPEEIERSNKINKAAFEIVKKAKSDDELHSELASFFNNSKIDADAAEYKMNRNDFIDLQIKTLSSPWMQYFLKYNPATDLVKVHCPVLALNGEKDLQVPAKENIDGIKKALVKAGNKNVTTKILPNLNHLFQECKTGAPSEYSTIEQTFSPIALKEMLVWLKSQSK